MLALFRTNQLFGNILLLLYLCIVRLSIFIHSGTLSVGSHGLLSGWLYNELPPQSKAAQFAALFLVFFQAAFINIIVIKFRLAREATLLPGLFYCLLSSIIPDFMTLSTVLLSNTFLILSVYYMLDVYKGNSSVTGTVFDIGFWLGLASLFNYSFILLIIWAIIGLSIMLGARFRDILILLLGFVLPFFLLGVYLFWYDKLPLFFTNFYSNFGWISFTPQTSNTTYIKLAVMGVLVLTSVFLSGILFAQKTLSVQKFFTILYVLMLISGLTIFVVPHLGLDHLLVVVLPLSIFIAFLFQRLPSGIAEALHFALVAVTLVLQFEYLLV